ncbi:MAG: hypothetical protein AAF715_11155 [Myxococcota bacterium]
MANGGGSPPPGGGWGHGPPPGPVGPGWGRPTSPHDPYAPPATEFRPPAPGMPPGYQPGATAPLQGGVAWETRAGFVGRFVETLVAANFKGKAFYAAVAAGGNDPMPAVFFHATAMALVGFFIGIFYLLIFSFFGAMLGTVLGGLGGRPGSAFGAAGVGLGFGLLGIMGMTLLYGIIGFVTPWVTGGIHHLTLAIASGVGEGRDYSSTVRTHAYASGASVLWVAIPGLGAPVSLVFQAINHTIGYDEMHRCGGGKAFLAWVAPMLVCCCCYLFGVVFFATLGAAGRP